MLDRSKRIFLAATCYLQSNGIAALGAKEAEKQNGKNYAADHDIDLVFPDGKTKEAESDPHDRGRDHHQNAQSDDAATIQVANALEDRSEPVGGAGNSVKMAIT